VPVAAIAIVDDDEDVRSALCSVVRHHGIPVRDFASGEALLRVLYREAGGLRLASDDEDSPDRNDEDPVLFGAVLDIGLPGIDGANLARHLRSLSPSLPVVVVTAYDGHDRERYGGVLEGITCVRKPFELSSLMEGLITTLELG